MDSLLVADLVFPQGNGKWTAQGVFTGLSADTFPLILATSGALAAVHVAAGVHAIQLRFTAGAHVLAVLNGPVLTGPAHAVFGMQIGGLAIPAPGTYTLELLVDGGVRARWPLTVSPGGGA